MRLMQSNPSITSHFVEGIGFEPMDQVTPITGLANQRNRPLCQPSI